MKAVLQQVASSIRGWGYRGSRQNYRRLVGDIIFVINFQKSHWGDCFYVNLGGQPSAISGDDPNPKSLKEYDCIFRYRLPGGWRTSLSAAETASLTATVDVARQKFETKVEEMRELSRLGRAQRLFDTRSYMGPEARAAFLLARMLAADGHADGARTLAEFAITNAGQAHVLRLAAQALVASLPSR
jgi:hypothetical protein